MPRHLVARLVLHVSINCRDVARQTGISLASAAWLVTKIHLEARGQWFAALATPLTLNHSPNRSTCRITVGRELRPALAARQRWPECGCCYFLATSALSHAAAAPSHNRRDNYMRMV